MPTALKFYVDPGAGGSNNGTSWANAYTTMNAWEQANDQNLTAGGGGSDSTMTCYFRSSGAHNADTTAVAVYGWTTDATHWIKILHGQWESPVDGSTEALGGAYYNTGQYRIEVTNAIAFDIEEDYVTAFGIQSSVTSAAANNKYACLIGGQTATNNAITVAYSYFRGDDSDAYYSSTFSANDTDLILTMYNCVAWNRRVTISSSDAPFRLNTAAGSVIYNCTGYGGYRGMAVVVADSVTAKNCLVFNTSSADYYGTFNSASDYNVSEDATAPNGGGHSITSHDCAGFFDSEATGDFRLNASIDHGVSLSATFTDDMAKVARSTWDVGADEYVAGGGGPGASLALLREAKGSSGSGSGNFLPSENEEIEYRRKSED